MPPVSAAVWMIIGSVAFAGMNVVIRFASDEMHTYQLVFFRNLFGLLWMAPWLMSYGMAALRTGRIMFYVFRSSLGLVGMYGSFYAVTHMVMADATALSFTAPLFATVGAVLFLGERIRLRRTIATLVGFLGVLIVLRPGPEMLNPVAIIALIGSAAGAASILVVRSLSKTEPPNAIVVYMVLFLAPMSLPAAIWVWVWPSWTDLGLMVILGGLGTLGHLSVTRAYAMAEATAVLPYDYLRLPVVALGGFLAFGELPDHWTFAGAGVIALSSIYIARREAQVKRSQGVAGRSAIGDGAPKHPAPGLDGGKAP
ncbi:MAG: DMT family transporter [Elsteraceae bacterium]